MTRGQMILLIEASYMGGAIPLDTQARVEAAEYLRKADMIEDAIESSDYDNDEWAFDTTPKGNAYMKMLEEVPVPVLHWVDPRAWDAR